MHITCTNMCTNIYFPWGRKGAYLGISGFQDFRIEILAMSNALLVLILLSFPFHKIFFFFFRYLLCNLLVTCCFSVYLT